MPCIFHSAFLLFILSSLLSAQAPPTARSTTSATPTFRANSRLVQFDVIVLDGNGRPIRGLAQNDFKIFEDGKPQQVRSFDAHETKLTAQPQEPFHLPPHQYTNVPVDEPRGPLTVILFDTLNTPTLDQSAARRHLIEKIAFELVRFLGQDLGPEDAGGFELAHVGVDLRQSIFTAGDFADGAHCRTKDSVEPISSAHY